MFTRKFRVENKTNIVSSDSDGSNQRKYVHVVHASIKSGLGFARIFITTDSKQKKKIRAFLKFSRRALIDRARARAASNNERRFEDPIKEIRLLQRIPRHSRIIRFIEAGEIKLGQKDYVVLCLEACDDDFLELLNSQGALSEKVARKYFGQMVEGLSFLHSQGIAHLDFSLENVMLRGDDVVLIDLGQARTFDPTNPASDRSSVVCGKFIPMHPEMFQASKATSGTTRSWSMREADTWSLGWWLHRSYARAHTHHACTHKILTSINPTHIFIQTLV